MAGKKVTKTKLAELPAWYLRMRRQIKRNVSYTEDEWNEEDFDEDISELEDSDDDSEEEYESDDMSDTSEASYIGPDADHYYELKEKREERKWVLKDMRETDSPDKKRLIKSHRAKMEEVQKVQDALEEELNKGDGTGSPIDFWESCDWGSLGDMIHVRSKPYDLYSVDYAKNCYQPEYYHYWKSVSFEEYDEPEEQNPINSRSKPRRKKFPSAEPKTGDTVHCQIYASPSHDPQLKPFCAPLCASLKKYPLNAKDGTYEITIQFIGEDHFKMQIPRRLIEGYKNVPVSESAPEMFEFVGIMNDFFKERKLERKKAEQRKRIKTA